MDRASVGYEPGKPILTGLSFRFDPEDRVALLGKNGNGKSTMAKLLAGKLAGDGRANSPRRASWWWAISPSIRPKNWTPTVTPILTLQRLRPKLTVEQVRGQLGRLRFLRRTSSRPWWANLSGGERARLMLALATLDKPNLLILDEPTNHLDIDARNELLTALNDFDGAVILVSHDRRLIEATAERLLLVADGHVTPFEGDLDDYRRYPADRRQYAVSKGSGTTRARARSEGDQGRSPPQQCREARPAQAAEGQGHGRRITRSRS